MKDENKEPLGFHNFIEDKKRSPLQKYQDIAIGKRSLLETAKYELLTLLFGRVPGLFGLFARQKFYRLILGGMGKRSVIGKDVTLRHPSKFFLGNNSIIDEYCHISARGGPEARIIIGENSLIGRHSSLRVRDGRIEIDDYADIGEFCNIGTTSSIKIGKYVLIAAYTYVGAAYHTHEEKDKPIALQGHKSRGGVSIGDNVWLGTKVTVTDGVTIGEGAIVGAHSLVNKDIPPYAIAFGTPAKVVKYRE